MAEPFRVLVVANFPANFSVEAARRLVSIASSGARCGVYTLISVDPKAPMPQGFNLKELEGPSVVFTWKDDHFVWKDADFEKYPLTLDAPPDDPTDDSGAGTWSARRRAASSASRCRSSSSPRPGRLLEQATAARASTCRWAGPAPRACSTCSSARARPSTPSSPARPAPANRPCCTPSSPTWRCCYGPDEVELYLIDFKKGVEFKTYAVNELPHARVVAIESEREFGLSVLQRLDAELKARGDRFREAGVQDIASYRQLNGSTVCPRILLIVDEFQEFFVEDDKVAQEAALLLDRLVRQGRAFGIHVLLGSQTLGGAYTLARSTIDQMAVRIALQCSEADAHLILSKDNAAARLLSRPGEAIYNDANGLVEGNDIFQIVWLSDEQRDELPPAGAASWPGSAATSAAAADHRLRGQRTGRRREKRSAPQRDCRAGLAAGGAGGPGLARRGHRHQGPDGRALPGPERQQPAAPRPAGGDGPGRARRRLV